MFFLVKYVYAIRMEEWNVGMLASGSERILRVKSVTNHFNCKKFLSFNLVQDKLTYHFITPSFHYSNWGEAPKLSRFLMDGGFLQIK